MKLWTGALSLWKCYWSDLKSAASSLGISSWTPLKPQHSNLNLLANQLESLMPHKNWCSIHARYSKSSLKHSIRFCGVFSKFKTILLHIVVLKCQIAFLKFTSCDNQVLVGCIPIPAVAVHLNLKSSYKMYSNNIGNFQESTTILWACMKKSLETYWIHHVYI